MFRGKAPFLLRTAIQRNSALEKKSLCLSSSFPKRFNQTSSVFRAKAAPSWSQLASILSGAAGLSLFFGFYLNKKVFNDSKPDSDNGAYVGEHVRTETQAYNEPYMQQHRIEDSIEAKLDEKKKEMVEKAWKPKTPEEQSNNDPKQLDSDASVYSDDDVPEQETSTEQGNITKQLEEVEEEGSEESAFDPETGEINWDCPCLGGMAHGPCGEEFKAAFSCFVYSKSEPKGMECLEKFQAMQTCFQQHPDVYKDLTTEKEEGESSEVPAKDAASSNDKPVSNDEVKEISTSNTSPAKDDS
ncbi:TIM22 inner membrane protein import complex subunit Tim40 [Schizosaccharomyces cryophilus OY26]|uniref:Mitochondrial intermembrane space import and assembly protein 40 n=1 Tax=Schizosaccharomyces cryophilus (strain OY26 / ATCC MYA-4695 / CBS 11777 / NBRC 106824 / NRRL Y48691) TaxID=653667 RepID=S9VYN9_SCHCR|nr:TIM22 inner membrane protein import complex subunit Tim40 [Schizosaccharomyces cryophilus OY26]EPY50935.1 TIM22 inner membrane protein import complex subunit Tim40 [Schizosaccharomyces cryophilus OY26]